MQYSFVLAALASSVLAAPWGAQKDNSVVVTLSNQAIELGTTVSFTEGSFQPKAPSGSDGPFRTVLLSLGKDVKQQDLRCKILDDKSKPIILTRGENIDITFGDGKKGEWTFKKESKVSQVICDPTFKKIDPVAAKKVTVILQNQATETGSQTEFTDMEVMHRAIKMPVGSTGPFETFELKVGALVDQQDLRCAALDKHGNAVEATRGKNTDITFSDAGKGAWTFHKAETVNHIVCDPTFKSKN